MGLIMSCGEKVSTEGRHYSLVNNVWANILRRDTVHYDTGIPGFLYHQVTYSAVITIGIIFSLLQINMNVQYILSLEQVLDAFQLPSLQALF